MVKRRVLGCVIPSPGFLWQRNPGLILVTISVEQSVFGLLIYAIVSVRLALACFPSYLSCLRALISGTNERGSDLKWSIMQFQTGRHFLTRFSLPR